VAVGMTEQAEPTVFYSWQADRPGNGNRYFIERALAEALKALATSGTIAEADRPVVATLDQATSGIAGAPDIVPTLFAKIAGASAFVADVTLINTPSAAPGWLQLLRRDEPAPRPTPNPNVLIETGYAFHALGSTGLILVVNTAFGPIRQLPFDLQQKRLLAYHLPPGAADKAEVRKRLVGALTEALRLCLAVARRPPPVPDLPWEQQLDRGWPNPRYASVPVRLNIGDQGQEDGAVRLYDFARESGGIGTPGVLQPIVFQVLEGAWTTLPAEPLAIAERCIASAVASHKLTGAYLMDLVVRWSDYEGGKWLAVLVGAYKDFRVARWVTPEGDDPVLILGLDQGGAGPTMRRVVHPRQFTVRPITVEPHRMYLGDTHTPRHEIVERLWVGPRSGWRASIPTERLTQAGIEEATTQVLLLTRIWRWRGDGFVAVDTTIVATEVQPVDGPWP